MRIKRELKSVFLFCLILVLGSFFYVFYPVNSYQEKFTHPALTMEGIELYNKSAGIKIAPEEMNWIRKGSVEEDKTPRWINHFYDPIHKSGLKESINGNPAKNAIEWAHSSINQTAPLIGKGDYTWEAAIYYYQKGNKERAFISLGHILHLLEDMGVPAHVRDDSHPEEDPYEVWAEDYNLSHQLDLAKGEIKNCLSLEQCFTDLALYTNQNFFSKDTIESTKYKSPKIINERSEIINGDLIDYGYNNLDIKLVKIEKSYGIWNLFEKRDYKIDTQEIHESYWNDLGPKTVSYVGGLIKLFMESVKKEERMKPISWGESKINGIKTQFNEVKAAVNDNLHKTIEAGKRGFNIAKNEVKEGVNLAADLAASAGRQMAEISENLSSKTVNLSKQVLNVPKSLVLETLNLGKKIENNSENIKETNEKEKEIEKNLEQKIGKVLGEVIQDSTVSNIKDKSILIKDNLEEPLKKVIKEITILPKTINNLLNKNKFSILTQEKAEAKEMEIVKIKRVIDGDTIELENGEKVRYIGIDTPELNGEGKEDDECLAWLARLRNMDLLEQGKDIRFMADNGGEKDKYGRLLRYVYVNSLIC